MNASHSSFLIRLTLLASLALTACDSATVSSPVITGQREGGISGGGGGTVPADTVTVRQIRSETWEARGQLVALFNALEVDSSVHLFGPLLYDGEIKIQDIIQSTEFHLEEIRPCYDRDGKEVDGSVVGPRGSICISAFSLQPKLTSENLRSQLLGLMAHEYSHLLGTDEALATAVQTEIIRRASETSEESILRIYGNAASILSGIRMQLDWAYVDAQKGSASKVCDALEEATKQFQDLVHLLDWTSRDYRAMSTRQSERLQQFQAMNKILQLGVCSLESLIGHEVYSRDIYDRGYAGQTTLTTTEFFLNIYSMPAERISELSRLYPVHYVAKTEDATTDLLTLKAQLADLERQVRSQYTY